MCFAISGTTSVKKATADKVILENVRLSEDKRKLIAILIERDEKIMHLLAERNDHCKRLFQFERKAETNMAEINKLKKELQGLKDATFVVDLINI